MSTRTRLYAVVFPHSTVPSSVERAVELQPLKLPISVQLVPLLLPWIFPLVGLWMYC